MHYHRSSFKPLRCIIGDAERLGGSTDHKHVAAVLFAMVVIIRGTETTITRVLPLKVESSILY